MRSVMKDEKAPEKFSEHFALQFRRFRQWLLPDPQDPPGIRMVKTFFKSIAVVLLILFSPVMLIGLFLGFVGLL